MNPSEIHHRTATFSNACLKVSAVLQPNQPLVQMAKVELVRYASDLAIQTRGLMSGQISSFFVERLNKAVDSCHGCHYWLEMVEREKLLDSVIVEPLMRESLQLAQMFMAAAISAKSKGKLE
ncbi:MAG: hypothetical protein H6608_02590 [Flavobacteriales bacterium]|nr:hypothetical protein [Bacteroidota bacterium]MCB9239995.1 hypothetical protein [Flavobacteriales bacterium]